MPCCLSKHLARSVKFLAINVDSNTDHQPTLEIISHLTLCGTKECLRVAKYKDMNIPSELIDVIPYMNDVDSYREELMILGQAWDLLTILGRMSGGRTDMTSTREDFRELTEKLIVSLGYETLSKTVADITSKAQVSVDIIIRNLFERTADIGFLATDDDIRDYLRSHPSLEDRLVELASPEEESPKQPDHALNKAELVERFQEYVAKYSVYHNIILLDTKGNVLAQLDESNGLTKSIDPIINEALTTQEEYVEQFAKTDMVPEEDQSLLYAYRVTETNEPDSEALGVLCLCFRFENEMQGIFNNLSGHDDWSVITLLDESGKVIASNSPFQIPIGAELDLVLKEDYRITHFAGRKYLAKTLETNGYQGFFGLGWKGHVMIPVDTAFEGTSENVLDKVNPKILASILNNPRIFSEEIQTIPDVAEQIQSELDRTVWNGNVSSYSKDKENITNASKVLLWEISRTGNKTKNVFSRAIKNLHETIVSTYMNDVEFLSSLAIDIMDRNLYERANDCRWWALTSEFRRILSLPVINNEEATKAENILQYINNLYTVYTNLVLYDRTGKVIAVSNPSEGGLVGTSLGESWVDSTIRISSTQDYCVSDFEATQLYMNKPTYIYNAAIKSLENSKQVIGGIGIVFDSAPQFEAMLKDTLPRDKTGAVIDGCFAAFIDETGHVISSTHRQLSVGSKLEIDLSLLAATQKSSRSSIVKLNDAYYAIGIRESRGYREYKSNKDKYVNTVYATVFMELDKVVENAETAPLMPKLEAVEVDNSLDRTLTSDFVEIATFFINDQWYGIEVDNVIEAIKVDEMSKIPTEVETVLGSCFFEDEVIIILDPSKLLGDGKKIEEYNEVVVIETDKGRFGLVVTDLGKIPRIDNRRLNKETDLLAKTSKVIKHIISPEKTEKFESILIVLEPNEIYDALTGGTDFEFDKPKPAIEWAKQANI